MKLTAKQEAFAQAMADGASQADAYRKSYGQGRMSDTTIHQKASRLMGKVQARVTELRGKLEAKALWTRERSVAVLADIADGMECKAVERVAAVKELNAMHGFNAPAKVELQGAITVIERRIVRP